MRDRIALDRGVAACVGDEPGIISRPGPQSDDIVGERHNQSSRARLGGLPPRYSIAIPHTGSVIGSGDIRARLQTTASRTLAAWRRRTRTGSATSRSMMIRTSTCCSPRWTEPPDGTRRSDCGRGSEPISASLMVNGCSTWAAASGRQRSRSPRISAKAGRSSASTCPRRMLRVARSNAGAARCRVRFTLGDACSLDEPDDSFDAVRSERTLQWLADPAAAVAEMVRVVRPGGRVSLIDTDWSTFTIDVGDDALAALVRDGMRTERNRPSNVGRRLHDLVSAAGCVPHRENRGDADLDDLGPRRVAGTAWLLLDGEPRRRPRRHRSAGDRQPPAVRVDDPRRRATRSVLDAPHDVRGCRCSPVGIGSAYVVQFLRRERHHRSQRTPLVTLAIACGHNRHVPRPQSGPR